MHGKLNNILNNLALFRHLNAEMLHVLFLNVNLSVN